MKKIIYFITVLILLACNQESPSDFRMMLRLWSDYSDNPEMTDALLEAFEKYDFCDEVWFKAETPATHCRTWHEEHAALMAQAAEKMRGAGVRPSLQGVSIGHGDGMTVFDVLQDSTIHWGTMTGPDGSVTASVNCPRQQAFLDCIEEAYVPYAEAFHPHSIYLDDDLRLTHHTPATMGCYCPTCISLFNKEHGYSYTRESLVEILMSCKDGGRVRREWIAFGQESLAGVARAVARGVHRVSPETSVGLQHASFHRKLMEGYDWNPIFRAIYEETGIPPVSRPGNGFYDDHSPRGMLKKGMDIARQIRRLDPCVGDISPEIEGYVHKASGKSPHSLAVETMYYLAMGGTSMSYAIVSGSREPVSWYADHYFKALAEVKPFAKEYAAFNKGTLPHGIDPLISTDLACSGALTTTAGNEAFDLAPLGLPFAPDDPGSPLMLLDAECIKGMCDAALDSVLHNRPAIIDEKGFGLLDRRGLLSGYMPADFRPRDAGDYDSPFITPGGRYSDAVARFRYMERGGCRLLVIPSFSINLKQGTDYNGAFCMALLHSADWASGRRLAALPEEFAQVSIVPRTDTQGRLRSVALLNCSISAADHYTLRIRTGAGNDRLPRLTWKVQGMRDRRVKAVRDGSDLVVTVPGLEGWHFGWLAVDSR